MKRILTLVIFATCNLSIAQSFQKDFAAAFHAKDTLTQLKVLNTWKKAKPKDPELYTSFFNYYFHLAKKEIINITPDRPNGESLALTDSLNKTAGYMGSTVHYDLQHLAKAFEKIDQGIIFFPDRLDMRFGKIYAMGKIEDWENFTIEIIRTINHSKINNNKWLWTNDVEKTDGKLFMLSSIQSYQMQLYNTENDNLLPKMQQIALAVLEIYQDHIESMSNLSVTYFLNKKYDQGIEILLKAEKLSPKDYVILSNIAHGYNLKGNKTKSIEYYEKTLLYGTDEAKAFAKEKIEKLKK
jgi:tetratricopeptide (TPR) repeat protein